jgi:predicted lipoprotein with Yx(FWY)xxD motif
MQRVFVLLLLGLIFALGLISAQGADTQGGTTGGAGQEAEEVTAEEPLIQISQDEGFGQYLTDAEGRALYVFLADDETFSADGQKISSCYDECAENWPPLLARVEAVAGEGVDASLLNVIERSDATAQVRYNNWPLYYFSGDENPGDINGHAIEAFGARWHLISAEGEPIGADSEGTTGGEGATGGEGVTGGEGTTGGGN